MNDYNPRPTKRTKYRACDSCVTSKTRCDDVTSDGCLVCRKRNKSCSLAEVYLSRGDGSLRPSPSLAPEEGNEDLRKRMEVVEGRSWDMEQRLQAVEMAGSSRGRSTPQAGVTSNGFTDISPLTHLDPVVDVETETSRLIGKTYLSRFDERLFSPVDVRGFPDALKRGLVTVDQVDMAFQLFKHRFSKVLPLAPFLVSSTPTPSHPFVVLAILTHIPVIAGSLVAPLVEESVRHVFSGAVGQEVMLAFLILALRPSRPDQMGGPSPLRLLSTAYEIGKSLGLERFARAACKRKTVLCEPWWADVLERILLFEAVKAQYNLLQLAHSKFDDFAPSWAAHLPDHPLDNFNEAITHLRSLCHLIDIFRDYVSVLAEAEAEMFFSDSWSLQALLGNWEPISRMVEQIPNQYFRLTEERHLIMFALCVRTTMYLQTLPTPVRYETKALGYTWIFESMLKYTFATVAWFLETEAELPQRTLMSVVFAISSARRVKQFYVMANQKDPDHLDFSLVEPAEEKLLAMGGAAACVLVKVRAAFDNEMHRHAPLQVSHAGLDSNALFPANDPIDWMNVFNVDFSSWETLLSTFGPVDDGVFGHTDGGQPEHGQGV